MKLPFPWRRPVEESKQATQATLATADAPIDITIPRECYYESFEGQPGPCPRCGGQLRQSRQTYLVTTRRGRHVVGSFIMGSDFGWFCDNCPALVINSAEVNKMIGHGLLHWDTGEEFAVAGIVNLDAVPEDKRDLPLGDDGNPIPLVEFTYPSDRPLASRKRGEAERKARARRKQEKAMRRKQRKQR